MNHWDRLQAALRAEPLDCRPIALWRHWPEIDHDPMALARSVMGWQRRHDFDLVVFTPPDACVAEHWGARIEPRTDALGRRRVARHAVTDPQHWLQLRPSAAQTTPRVDYNDGLLRLAEALGGTVPLLQSVPSPLTTAWQLAGDALFEHLRSAPDCVEAGLRTLTDATAAFARAATAAGANGIRLVVRLPERARLGRDEHARFGCRFDREVLAAAGAAWHLLELDAGAAWFEACADYPVRILNWHDRAAGPDVRTGGDRFSGLVAGGLDAQGPLFEGSRSQVYDQIVATVRRLGDTRAVLSAGGPCRPDTPEANIDAAIDAVRRHTATPNEGRGA